MGRDLTDLEDNDESFECFHLPTEKFFFAFWLHLVFTILIGTCLEVIEHMEEDQALLFDDVALSYFHPKVLIISTPNYEYNVILQNRSKLANGVKGSQMWNQGLLVRLLSLRGNNSRTMIFQKLIVQDNLINILKQIEIKYGAR
ncbi:hypothetical protein K2173_004254 [Erythroxylum novogranatense]|uniref:Small RNA 2'-O-methyltransferase n=1 Tax=Erythroxylum novogranatense TaxID=1862640 RepID=A0AAV8TTU0_9ROSI|nr:hypothetical protein K2173_004254 [Erythroxylum novogranatense]